MVCGSIFGTFSGSLWHIHVKTVLASGVKHEIMLRIGFINYLNSKPLYEGLIHPELEVVSAEPKKLAELLLMGELDFGQISSLVFLENHARFMLFDRYCVAAQTAHINSVLLVSKYPLTELGGKLISLTDRSSTSSRLLQILLEKFYKIQPNYQTTDLTSSPLEEQTADALLIIGDQALKLWEESHISSSFGYYIYDLAELWTNWTGLPFVFAVFVGQKDLKLPAAIAEAIWKNSLNKARIIQRALALGFQEKTLQGYYSNLSYQLTPHKVESLALFGTYAGYQPVTLEPQTINFRLP